MRDKEEKTNNFKSSLLEIYTLVETLTLCKLYTLHASCSEIFFKMPRKN
jgi:hypothetical protein